MYGLGSISLNLLQRFWFHRVTGHHRAASCFLKVVWYVRFEQCLLHCLRRVSRVFANEIACGVEGVKQVRGHFEGFWCWFDPGS